MAPCFDRVVTSLLCAEDACGTESDANEETIIGSLQSEMQIANTYPRIVPVEEDEIVTVLMRKEESLTNKIKDYVYSYEGKDAEVQMRLRMINWMLEVNAHYGFNALTAFLSVSYFDHFLFKHASSRGKAWLLQLVAVGSISLAAKLEETEVPLLLDLQIGDIEHVFESCTIQRMELLIMSTLNWEMSLVTPFSFFDHLLHKIGFRNRSSETLIARSEELILRSCKDLRFLTYSPSAVATASIMLSCKELPIPAERLQRALLSFWPMKTQMEAMEWSLLMDEMLQADPFWASPSAKEVLRNPSAPESPIGVLDARCFSNESCKSSTSCTRNCDTVCTCMRSSGSKNIRRRWIALISEKPSFIESPTSSSTSRLPCEVLSKRPKLMEHDTDVPNKHDHHS
ncbi:hypothetical protein KP509_14G055100 [Ceratopteris richardii]|uniref:Cyclin-like domain-containing protein n=1 Tax=Ceratopteris richardii TaxID=49495 RepID=A0A8T2TD43_CERRI|nr:hypothetical protein KP509_14G055100 [Ceratopteris richardii]